MTANPPSKDFAELVNHLRGQAGDVAGKAGKMVVEFQIPDKLSRAADFTSVQLKKGFKITKRLSSEAQKKLVKGHHALKAITSGEFDRLCKRVRELENRVGKSSGKSKAKKKSAKRSVRARKSKKTRGKKNRR